VLVLRAVPCRLLGAEHAWAAHAQIRTPLHAVGGATALLADTPLNDEQRELVALLNAGTSHVVSIIEGALPLSQPSFFLHFASRS
jgi:hypothetical protein